MNLPEFSVKRPTTTLMIFFALLLIGLVALSLLPIDLLPEFDLPAISVVTSYEGAAAEDIETKITEPLEDAITRVPDLKHIASKSLEGTSVITATFEWGTDLDTRANDVRDMVGMAEMLLPDDAEKPLVLKFDVSRMPIMFYGVTARQSYPNLKNLIEDEIADPLKRLPGVGAVVVRGALERRINIHFDRQRLESYGLIPQQVVQAIHAENQTIPAGSLKVGDTDYIIRVPGEFKQLQPMKKIVLANHSQSLVRLEDVATVEDGFEEKERIVRLNGQDGIMFMVMKQSGANTVQVARAVERRLAELKKNLPPDVGVIKIMDSAEDIIQTINDLAQTLLLGGILAMLAVFIFLRRSRATIIIALTMPFSLVCAIVLIYLLGYTINMMTLFAMTIGIGMIVDNAIVILENITRHREEGERGDEAAVYGSSEVAMAITASTLTTVSIFIPLIFVRGIIKILFGEFAIILSVVLLGSLFSALTLTPMLSSRILPHIETDQKSKWGLLSRFYQASEQAFTALSEYYGSVLGWALRHRAVVIVAAVIIFGSSFLLVPMIGTEFTPQEDRNIITGYAYLPIGTRVEKTDEVMQQIESIMTEEIPAEWREAIFTRCGRSEAGVGSIMGEEDSHIGMFGIKLVTKGKRDKTVMEIAEALRRRIKRIPELDKFSVDVEDPMAGMMMGGEKPVSINILGEDIDKTDQLAQQIKAVLETVPGAKDVTISREKGKPELWVEIDRDKAYSMGLNVSDIADTLRVSFSGREASKYRIGGDEYDIFVKLRDKDRQVIPDIGVTPIRLPKGPMVNLASLATVTPRYGPLVIERQDQERIVKVGASTFGRSLGEVVGDTKKEIAKLAIPSDIDIEYGGHIEQQEESFFWLFLAIGIGVIMVYMVMASQFESLVHPFVIMFSVPFAFTGVLWALFLGGFNLNIAVFIGILLLVGVVVNNAIVLVDYTNILRARGLNIFAAAQQAGKIRLRPVLMTAFTTILALVPMTFTRGQGSEWWNPLGATVLSGLLVSTLVTLILVPTIYTIVETHARTNNHKPQG